MKITTIPVDTYYHAITLGRQEEHQIRRIVFDFAAWVEQYGPGTVQLALKRNGDAAPYPVALDIQGTDAAWDPSPTDLAVAGTGAAQLTYRTADGTIAKSVIYKTDK